MFLIEHIMRIDYILPNISVKFEFLLQDNSENIWK